MKKRFFTTNLIAIAALVSLSLMVVIQHRSRPGKKVSDAQTVKQSRAQNDDATIFQLTRTS